MAPMARTTHHTLETPLDSDEKEKPSSQNIEPMLILLLQGLFFVMLNNVIFNYGFCLLTWKSQE